MKKYFDFNGTAKRQEYWAVMIISLVALIVAAVLAEAGSIAGAGLALIGLIAILWAIISTTVRRIRDCGLSTWWTILIFVPYIAIIAQIVFGVLPSKE